MKTHHYKALLLLLPGFFFHGNAAAQSIRGDTIYVDVNKVVTIAFPSPPDKAELLSNGSEDRLYEVNDMGGKSLSILVLKDKAKNQNLEVTEGGRKHLFILSFKSGSPARSIDLSTKKKVAARADETKKQVAKALNAADDLYKRVKAKPLDEPLWKEMEARYAGLKMVIADAKDLTLVNQRQGEIEKQLKVIDINKKYSQAIDEGNSNYRQEKYAEAKEAYVSALTYKPGDASAKKWIRFTDSTWAKDNMDKGDAANKGKNYVEAKKYYQTALTIMADDPSADYPALQEKFSQTKKDADPLIYDMEKKNGDAALKANDIPAAHKAYDAALAAKPDDSYIKVQLEKVRTAEQRIKEEEKDEAAYQDILTTAKELAEKATDGPGYDLAIKEYQRASNRMPGRIFPAKRIKELARLKERAKVHGK